LVGGGRRRAEAAAIAKEVVLGFAIVRNAFRSQANKRRILQLAGAVGVARPGFSADAVGTGIALVARVLTGLNRGAGSVGLGG
jgi:hypothetical protein